MEGVHVQPGNGHWTSSSCSVVSCSCSCMNRQWQPRYCSRRLNHHSMTSKILKAVKSIHGTFACHQKAPWKPFGKPQYLQENAIRIRIRKRSSKIHTIWWLTIWPKRNASFYLLMAYRQVMPCTEAIVERLWEQDCHNILQANPSSCRRGRIIPRLWLRPLWNCRIRGGCRLLTSISSSVENVI